MSTTLTRRRPAIHPGAARFGQATRALRRELGMTQQQFAEAVGLSHMAISKIERRGQGHLRLGSALQISEYIEEMIGIGIADMVDPDPSGRW